MTRLNFIRINIFYLLVILCTGCRDSVLVPDPIDPRLPMYTERGNNVAGAFINSQIWISKVERDIFFDEDVPEFNIYTEADSAILIFSGDVRGQSRLQITFFLRDFPHDSIQNIVALTNTKILIDGVTNRAEIINSDTVSHDCKLQGQLLLQRIQNVNQGLIIMSGTFGLWTEPTCNDPIEITYGRFDYQITPSFQQN